MFNLLVLPSLCHPSCVVHCVAVTQCKVGPRLLFLYILSPVMKQKDKLEMPSCHPSRCPSVCVMSLIISKVNEVPTSILECICVYLQERSP